VIYDRAGSSFASLRTGMIDWNTVLKGCSWFHFSAISPALNAQATEVCEEAVSIASGLGLTISVDLNYRSKLWKYGKQPVDVMPRLVKYCDVVMGNIWSAAELLGVTVDPGIHEKGTKEAYLAHATKTATGIRSLFPVCKTVANTFRFDDGNGIKYYAALDIDEGQFVSPLLTTREVKDKVGSGDCFMAGLIYGLYKEHQPQDVIDFAAAAAFGKLQETGDATSQTIRAVQNILSKTWTKMKP
jgi:2-dehydro-3-deoxygluconokinase